MLKPLGTNQLIELIAANGRARLSEQACVGVAGVLFDNSLAAVRLARRASPHLYADYL